ncbi:mechanosensitive ion channel domain-containing protein [Flavobacterium nackdongense]|uniref:Mechanosensitive ion channel n=1 Tax=Flavobacterium nackdongense TaxID=2547394 RepID=A0A4P6YG41_9FLAO|nr:mechanosensitive ion channel domain-containing protein [Flavobacterium nackdongense]QBN19894.1 mechanosensitive ion channel [Flavobacterium nackdongense]
MTSKDKTFLKQSKTKRYFSSILILILFSSGNFLWSQSPIVTVQNVTTTPKDTIIKPIPMKVVIENLVVDRLNKSQRNLENNNTIRNQNIVFNLINKEIQKANNILEQGIDYKGFTKEINFLFKLKDFAVDGITKNKNKRQTVRDLTTTSILLNELVSRTDNQIDRIKKNNIALSLIQKKLDSLSADKTIYTLPQDSIAKNNYIQSLLLLSKDIDETNKNLKNAIDSIQTLEIKANVFKNRLDSDIVKLDLLRKTESDSLFSRRVDFFSEKDIFEKSFTTELYRSMKKAFLVLTFYFVNNIAIIQMLALCLLGLYFYLIVVKRKYKKAQIHQKFQYTVAIFTAPFATAVLITITIGQILIPPPPIVFSAILWLIAAITLTYLLVRIKGFLPLKIWLVYMVLVFLILIDDLILAQTLVETVLLIAIGLAATTFGFYRIYSKNKVESLPHKWIVIAMIAFEIFGVLAMIFGNYNLSKILISIGLFTVFIGLLSLYTFQLTSDIVRLSDYIIESETKTQINFSFQENHKYTKWGYFLFLISWVIIINRNSYSFQNHIQPLVDAFSKEQSLGSFTYSYQSILIFFFVIIASVYISKIVSFLTSQTKTDTIDNNKSKPLGSAILLIRIAIISIGITFAFAIAGIPTDRLTVIIGALGVGIGFGLQTLVNNLVSGLIIAFEKPVNIDDIIEISGQTGTMKSIGIRSSVVTTWDGADIIIPNGDILSQHMTNWTMGSPKRRYEIKVGVAYGTNLKLARTLLQEILDQHSLILKKPEPLIWVTQFGDSSIDFVIKFWVPHFNYGNDVKSDLIIEIDEIFKLNDIVIPFPQQDVYIKTNTLALKEEQEEA